MDDCVDGLNGNYDLPGSSGSTRSTASAAKCGFAVTLALATARRHGQRFVFAAGSRQDVLFGTTGWHQVPRRPERRQLFGGAGRPLTSGSGKDISRGTGSDQIYAGNGWADRIDCGFGRDPVVSRREDKLTSCDRKAGL